MATFHAQFWGSEELDRMTWIAPVAYTSKVIHSMYRQSAKKLKSANEGLLTDRQTRLIDWLYEHGIELSEAQGEHPRTLLHGDFRLDNICFDDGSDDVLLFDWQTMQSGSAGMDLAYFLSAAMPLGTSEDKIGELIEHYRQKLIDLGIEVSPERMRWQYDVGMLSNLHRIAPALYQDQIEFGKERGPEMINGWIDKTFGKLENIEFEGILDRKPA
jgi:thiamine kinase-like enzyme